MIRSLLLRLRGLFRPSQATEPCYTEEDALALAELLSEAKLQGSTRPQQKKFRNLVLMDFPNNACYAQVKENGVTRRVQVPCPWQESAPGGSGE